MQKLLGPWVKKIENHLFKSITYLFGCFWTYAYYMMGMKLKCCSMSKPLCVNSVHHVTCLVHTCKSESFWVDTVCVNSKNHCMLEVCSYLHVHTHSNRCVCKCVFTYTGHVTVFHTSTRLSVICTIPLRSVGVQTVHYPKRLSNGWPVLLLKSHRMISVLLFILRDRHLTRP